MSCRRIHFLTKLWDTCLYHLQLCRAQQLHGHKMLINCTSSLFVQVSERTVCNDTLRRYCHPHTRSIRYIASDIVCRSHRSDICPSTIRSTPDDTRSWYTSQMILYHARHMHEHLHESAPGNPHVMLYAEQDSDNSGIHSLHAYAAHER